MKKCNRRNSVGLISTTSPLAVTRYVSGSRARPATSIKPWVLSRLERRRTALIRANNSLVENGLVM